LLAAISVADIVIAQVNRNMPYTLGKARIPMSAIDYLVEMDELWLNFPRASR